MARLFFLLVRVAIVVAGLALCPASAEAPKWPPDDPGQGTAKVEITTAWAGRLRDIREFADLQKAAGAGGRLASIENAGDAPHAVYTWTGYGENVPGSSKCIKYKMDIEVTVTGKEVKGIFQQEGRDQRHFETKLDKNGKIKTAAVVGGGNMMDVIGEIGEAGGKIKLEGYCRFEGPLTKKP